jgi:hypothetical protein
VDSRKRKRRIKRIKGWSGLAAGIGVFLLVVTLFPADTHGHSYRASWKGLGGTAFAVLFVLGTIACLGVILCQWPSFLAELTPEERAQQDIRSRETRAAAVRNAPFLAIVTAWAAGFAFAIYWLIRQSLG